MKHTEINMKLKWNSHSVQQEKECQLLQVTKIKTTFS